MPKTLLSMVLVGAIVLAVGGCGGQASEDHERSPQAKAAANSKPFASPAVREALELYPDTAAKYDRDLKADALPGATSTPVPATTTPATETPATETPATETPATETTATETPAAETPAAETPATETPAAEGDTTESSEDSDSM